MIDWESRAKVLADPDHSDGVKRAMMRFWLAADRHDTEAEIQYQPEDLDLLYEGERSQ